MEVVVPNRVVAMIGDRLVVGEVPVQYGRLIASEEVDNFGAKMEELFQLFEIHLFNVLRLIGLIHNIPS
jgi:hypothetical protein